MTDPRRRKALGLEFAGEIPAVRVVAMDSFDIAIESVAAAIGKTLAAGHPHLLVDAAGVAFGPPELLDRLRMVRLWAEAADGRLRVALVVRSDFIDPERFGVVAASNFGLAAQVFEQEADALAWLRSELAADRRRAASMPSLDALRALPPRTPPRR